MAPLGIALIGCGGFGRHLVVDIFKHVNQVNLIGVYDVDADAASRLAQTLSVEAFASLEEVWRSTSVEAVLIASPHDTHMGIAVAAAEAGKHIFCEKTMARTVKECRTMIQAAERHQVKLMVGHKRRLRPEYARLAAVVHSGILGKPLAVTVTGFHYSDYYRGWWGQTERSGGALYCAGSHDLDFIRFLCGEVQTVYAVEGPRTSDQHDWADSIIVSLRFQNGAVGSLQVAFTYHLLPFPESFTTQVACEDGGACYDPQRLAVLWQKRGEARQEATFSDYGFDEAYRLELQNFSDCIQREASLLLNAENGLRCVELLEAACRSISQRTVVELPLAD